MQMVVLLILFILQTTADTSVSAWHFYSQTQIPELNVLRIGFLLRLLIVDTKPFENLLEEILHKDSSWESRYVDEQSVTSAFLTIINADLKA
jgi:hypothetical protein